MTSIMKHSVITQRSASGESSQWGIERLLSLDKKGLALRLLMVCQTRYVASMTPCRRGKGKRSRFPYPKLLHLYHTDD